MNERKVAMYRGLLSRFSAHRKHSVQVRSVHTPKVRPCISDTACKIKNNVFHIRSAEKTLVIVGLRYYLKKMNN
jgi:hypothetical protein